MKSHDLPFDIVTMAKLLPVSTMVEKYKMLMGEKELEYQKLETEKKNALNSLDNLDIEY